MSRSERHRNAMLGGPACFSRSMAEWAVARSAVRREAQLQCPLLEESGADVCVGGERGKYRLGFLLV